MGYEKLGNTDTFDAASTGLRQYRFVTFDSTGGVDYPNASTVGQPVTGVIISSGTTGSTTAGVVTVQLDGIAKVEAVAADLADGATVTASSLGQAQPTTNAGDFVVGRVVDGSTAGSANRLVTVHIQPLGSSSPSTGY